MNFWWFCNNFSKN